MDPVNDGQNPPPIDIRSVAATAASFAIVYIALALPGLTGATMAPATVFATLFLGTGLALLSAVDFKTFRLPDGLTLPLLVAGLACAAALHWQPPVTWRLGAVAGGYVFVRLVDAVYRRVRGQTGIGQGDAKLFAAAGAWTGPEGLPGTLLYACAGALLFVIALALSGRASAKTDRIPFGPFLAGGLWLTWIYGPLVW